jgi:LacI family transcriptional regulator
MTVSRVLNGSPRVSDDTRLAVQQAIDELGYVPSRQAQRLNGSRLGVIALLVPDLSNPYFIEIVRSVEDLATANGLTVLVGNSDERAERERFFVETIAALNLDGAIIGATGDNATETIRRLESTGTPIVLIDRRVEGIEADFVVGAGEEPAYQLTGHLIDHGHTRIAVVAGPQSASTSRERIIGYERALRERKVPVERRLIRSAEFTRPGGHGAGIEILSLAQRPSAVVTANSFIAFGVIDAARQLGLSVPEDVAVVSFDDFEVTPAEPLLTCADQPAAEIGRSAVTSLLERMDGDDSPPRTMVLGAELNIRTSCGCAPVAPKVGSPLEGGGVRRRF